MIDYMNLYYRNLKKNQYYVHFWQVFWVVQLWSVAWHRLMLFLLDFIIKVTHILANFYWHYVYIYWFSGVDSNGRGLLYKNVLDCLLKTWYTEGIRGLYKGFIPQYVRGAPHTVLCLVFWDRLKSMRNQYFENTSAVGE